MITFAYKGKDKIFVIKGKTIRALGDWISKKSAGLIDPTYHAAQWLHGAGEYGEAYEDSNFLADLNGGGMFSSPPGSYLNARSACVVKDKLYAAYITGQTVPTVSPTTYLWPHHLRILEIDGLEDNVQKEANISPSGRGARIVFGYRSRGGWELTEGVIKRAADPALIEYHGNVLILGLGRGIDTGEISTAGDEAVKLQGPVAGPFINTGYYYSMLFNPMENSGSGLMYLKPSGTTVNLPTWISDAGADLTRAFNDTPYLNYNMTDAILHQGRVYVTNACDTLCWYGSGISYDQNNPAMEVFYKTDQNLNRPNPKWFAKFNENLYMYEASGVLSVITPRSGSTAPSKQNIVNFSYLGDMQKGGIHARENSIERATKASLFSYQDKLHVIMGGGSGTFYVHSPDASTWTNASSGLPAIMQESQGNVYHYYAVNEDAMYIFYVQMSKAGVLGITTVGSDVANVGHLYKLSGSTWTSIGWYPLPTMGGGGGFVGYDPTGPHIHYPSGAEFYYQEGTTNAPEIWKCRDHAVIDYWLYDKESRVYNVDIEYSIDDGETWDACKQKKDYVTQQPLGEGTTGLTSAPSGMPHTFYWNFVQALGYNIEYDNMRVRITPTLGVQ